jgi:hypothetical protein
VGCGLAKALQQAHFQTSLPDSRSLTAWQKSKIKFSETTAASTHSSLTYGYDKRTRVIISFVLLGYCGKSLIVVMLITLGVPDNAPQLKLTTNSGMFPYCRGQSICSAELHSVALMLQGPPLATREVVLSKSWQHVPNHVRRRYIRKGTGCSNLVAHTRPNFLLISMATTAATRHANSRLNYWRRRTQ